MLPQGRRQDALGGAAGDELATLVDQAVKVLAGELHGLTSGAGDQTKRHDRAQHDVSRVGAFWAHVLRIEFGIRKRAPNPFQPYPFHIYLHKV